MVLVDCFTFYNELDMLKYRLGLLNDIVDYFILVESTHTFAGHAKPLYYSQNSAEFKQYNSKIIHIVVDDMKHLHPHINYSRNEQWLNEYHQRNCIDRGLSMLNLNSSDLVMISDVDEISNPDVLKRLKNCGLSGYSDPLSLVLDLYYYNLNSFAGSNWTLSKILTYGKYRELNRTCNDIRNLGTGMVPSAGWHLSYFGDEHMIRNKIINFSHQEFNSDNYTDLDKIGQKITNAKDLFGRTSCGLHRRSYTSPDQLPPKFLDYMSKYVRLQE